MNEKDLFSAIKELKKIKPDSNWVSLVKSQILAQDSIETTKVGVFANLANFKNVLFRPTYIIGALSIFLLIGFFGLSQIALPGQTLYSVKKAIEKAETALVSSDKKTERDFELANKRLEEVNKLAHISKEKTEPAINEFKQKTSDIAKTLFATGEVNRELIDQNKQLEKNKGIAEQVLATKISTDEYDYALATLIRLEIEDLQKRTLTEEQGVLLDEAIQDFLDRNFDSALEKIYNLSNQEFLESDNNSAEESDN